MHAVYCAHGRKSHGNIYSQILICLLSGIMGLNKWQKTFFLNKRRLYVVAFIKRTEDKRLLKVKEVQWDNELFIKHPSPSFNCRRKKFCWNRWKIIVCETSYQKPNYCKDVILTSIAKMWACELSFILETLALIA